ncbi:MAG: hypothetical protein LC685_03785 [Actinobacteria bacterium]|nr:hypothetical protein [Actinomycetota bacterium]
MAGDPARVELERTGGLAGMRVRAAVPLDHLTSEERAGVDALLSRPSAGAAVAGPADRFQYDLTVVTDGREHHVRLGEIEIDDRLRPLIDRLEGDAAP